MKIIGGPGPENRGHISELSHLGRNVTKLVFGVSNIARLKSISSASETSWKIEVSPVGSLDTILSKKRITNGLISLRLCCWQTPKTWFLVQRPIYFLRKYEVHTKTFANDIVFWRWSLELTILSHLPSMKLNVVLFIGRVQCYETHVIYF